MNLHVGARGGAYMLEHFEDLANAKKLNANILRTGLKSELNYAEDRAMLPSQGGGQPGDRQRGGQQAGNVAAPKSEAEYNALPSGSLYTVNGVTKRKK